MEERIELIVQYVGDLARVQREMGFPAVMLLGGYAVVRIEPERIEELKSYPEIVYVELPTRLFYEVNNGKAVSCIGEVQAPSFLFPEAEASPETVGLSETVRLHETVGLSETVRLQETVRSPETVGLQETLRESGAPPEMPDSEIPSGRSALSGDMSANLALTGRGVLVAVIDSGIDYFHPDFRNGDGSSRIALLWDQSVRAGEGGLGIPFDGKPEFGYIYTKEDIDLALAAENRTEAGRLVPSVDVSGHGTHVAGIAAGNGRGSGGRYRGVAYESDLIVVKLGRSVGNAYPQTAGLMEGVDFALRAAIGRKQPVAVNISFGNNEGSHNGRSILESYLDTAAGIWKNSIVIGTGNEGTLGRHAGGYLREERTVELLVGGAEREVQFWLWKNYFDRFLVELITPEGSTTGTILTEEQLSRPAYSREFRLAGNVIRVLHQGPTPYNPLEQIRFQMIAGAEMPERANGFAGGTAGGVAGGNSGIDGVAGVGDLEGVWRLRLTPVDIVTGEYDIWLWGSTVSPDTRFLVPEEARTLTIPSTASLPVGVGAYNSLTGGTAYFSGRGYPRGGIPQSAESARGRQILSRPDFSAGAGGRSPIGQLSGREVKPDIAAPGVDILSAAVGGGYTVRSGTSMATPFVTGSAALMMQWGIVMGNDPELYGQRLKASLQRGANREGRGANADAYPNPEQGWGKLCVARALPGYFL